VKKIEGKTGQEDGGRSDTPQAIRTHEEGKGGGNIFAEGRGRPPFFRKVRNLIGVGGQDNWRGGQWQKGAKSLFRGGRKIPARGGPVTTSSGEPKGKKNKEGTQ